MIKEYYAHSKEGRPQKEWQPLEEHREKMLDRSFAGKVEYANYMTGDFIG